MSSFDEQYINFITCKHDKFQLQFHLQMTNISSLLHVENLTTSIYSQIIFSQLYALIVKVSKCHIIMKHSETMPSHSDNFMHLFYKSLQVSYHNETLVPIYESGFTLK